MTQKTMLYHGVPAIFRNDNWVLISPSFDEVVQIPSSQIDDSEVYLELRNNGFFDGLEQQLPDVFHVVLITTSDCNLRCRYCFANSGDSNTAMTKSMAFATIREAAKRAVGKTLSVAFFGGEPTLTHNLIRDVVEYSKQILRTSEVKDLQFSITTNGIVAPDFIRFLLKENFMFTVSGDGPDVIQNFHRPTKLNGGSSRALENTIKLLVAAQKQFLLRVTITDFSVDYMEKIVEWLHTLGGNQVQFEPISIAGRATLSTKGDTLARPSVQEFAKNLKLSISKAASLGVTVTNSSFMNLMNPPSEFCDGNIKHRFAVSYTGDVTTCVEVQDQCHPVYNEFVVGKYDYEQESIVFHKDKRSRACSKCNFSTQDLTCSTCFARPICGGGCPVRNYHTTGDSGEVDPYRCELIQEMLPFIIELFDEAAYNEI